MKKAVLGHSRKNPNRGGRGSGIYWVTEERTCGNSRSQWKTSAISKGDKENIMWHFHGPWSLALEFPRGVTQFCGILRGEASFSLEFQRVKWQT